MAIYRTRCRDPKEHRWASEWPQTRLVAEVHRAQIERRFAPRKPEIGIDRFELNRASPTECLLLKEHAAE